MNHSPYSPHKTGKVERKVASLKVLLRAHYGHLTDLNYHEFSYLLKKSQFLVNSRPVGSYSSAMSSFVISPNDIIFPAQSSMYSSDMEDFPQERTLWEGFNKTNQLYRAFKEMYLNLYLEAVRKRNKETSKRKLITDDVVIILDRLTRGSDMVLAQVISVDKDHKNVLLRTIQRGARVNNVYKIMDPARQTRLVCAPSSLVFIFRPNENVDLLEYYSSSSISAPDPETWNHVEMEPETAEEQ